MHKKQTFGEFTGVKRKGGLRGEETVYDIVALYSTLCTLMKKETCP